MRRIRFHTTFINQEYTAFLLSLGLSLPCLAWPQGALHRTPHQGHGTSLACWSGSSLLLSRAVTAAPKAGRAASTRHSQPPASGGGLGFHAAHRPSEGCRVLPPISSPPSTTPGSHCAKLQVTHRWNMGIFSSSTAEANLFWVEGV